MITSTIRKIAGETKKSGSKIMFQGDFKKELQKTIDILGEYIEKNLCDSFEIDSVIGGRNSLKIRINDAEHNVNKMINCIFRYHHDEEKFGHVNIEIVASEHSKETKLHFVGRFGVLERDKINKSVFDDVLTSLKKIY
ncbi:hypothetical protein KBD33_06015 [Candidatus Gracilibacteria bacterium]|nr:hypothetical protein [Candidatus Gracilibacteria bacterium]